MAEIVGPAGRDKSSTMKLVWSRRAIRHLVSLREHVEKDSEQNATLVVSRILLMWTALSTWGRAAARRRAQTV